jgi:hypothetical protein
MQRTALHVAADAGRSAVEMVIEKSETAGKSLKSVFLA